MYLEQVNEMFGDKKDDMSKPKPLKDEPFPLSKRDEKMLQSNKKRLGGE
jgi:hypothetical protein